MPASPAALNPLHQHWENQQLCKRRENKYLITVSRLALEMLTNFLDRFGLWVSYGTLLSTNFSHMLPATSKLETN